MRFSIFATAGLITLTSSAPATKYVVHEKREVENRVWISRDASIDSRAVLPMSISLTQQNLDRGYEFLMDVSDGKSSNYGKHWTPEQIAKTFAPTEEAVTTVKEWLSSHGIGDERVSISKSGSWIRFNSTIGEAEELMQTKYKVYEHSDTGKTHIACDDYSVPVDVKTHIDFITPTIGFDAYVREPKKTRALLKRDDDKKRAANITKPEGHAVAGDLYPLPPTGGVGPSSEASSLSSCNTVITPDCLRALYGFPVGTLNKSSYGIVEFTPQAYLQSDLNSFYASIATNVPAGYTPTLKSIDGGVAQTTYKSFAYNGESDLDLQYAIALVYPQQVTLYQAGDMVEGASFNDFLDAIDGSYCTYSGGDVAGYDAVYPDPSLGGYKGKKDCGTFKPSSVISISYAYDEAGLPASYMNRQCNEYMKLGLQGVTIVTSSGDNGVAGNGNKCCTNSGCAGGGLNAPGASGSFNPSFPGTCPYITSVGATQIVPGKTVTSPEEACATVIYSGGGFSNNFALPSYQSSAVGTYFKSHKPSYSTSIYNASGKTRAIPDVSANGANYLCVVDGAGQLIYGTSASAPTFGSIITLINEQRISAGKAVVGFINPVLYANPSALNDITKGSNPGCGTKGFKAVKGWDPLTGLGTPNYVQLLSVFMALP